MYPGTASTTIALSSAVHDNVIAGVTHAPGIHDDSWIHRALQKPVQFALKRAVDIVISGSVLALLLPFFAVIALLIFREDRGPVFFSQVRWGKGGKLIRIYKFRSMRIDKCDEKRATSTKEADPRVMRIG